MDAGGGMKVVKNPRSATNISYAFISHSQSNIFSFNNIANCLHILVILVNTRKAIPNQCSACPASNQARDLDPYLEQVGEASNQEKQSGHFLARITHRGDRKTPLCGKRFPAIFLGLKWPDPSLGSTGFTERVQ